MRSWGRQRWMVAVLGVLLVYLAWSRLVAPNFGGGATEFGGAAGREFHAQQIVELRADLLQAQTGQYKGGRNVFEYHRKRRPKPKPKPEPRKPEPEVKQAAASEPPAPKPPAFNMNYLGSFGPRERPIAVFVQGEDLYNLRVGDVVAEEFVLVRVGFESADIGFVNFPSVEPKRVAIAGS